MAPRCQLLFLKGKKRYPTRPCLVCKLSIRPTDDALAGSFLGMLQIRLAFVFSCYGEAQVRHLLDVGRAGSPSVASRLPNGDDRRTTPLEMSTGSQHHWLRSSGCPIWVFWWVPVSRTGFACRSGCA